MPLKIRGKDNCRWDLMALGEVMLRFDPGDRRIATTRSFDVYEGGGEYNVARGLKRCFGLETAAAFLRAGTSALGIGGELISKTALESGDLAAITETARQCTAIVNQAL